MSGEKIHWIDRLKKRWDLGSVSDVIIVLIVFACTGTSVLLIKPYVQEFLTAVFTTSETWSSILYYILILPVYNLMLLIYGFIFGKFRFFWKFELRFFKRIFRIK